MSKRNWHIIDAEGRVLGRLATGAARILMGKNRVDYTPHEDKGAFLIVTNADKIKLSGSKEKNKEYFFPSTQPGKSKSKTLPEVKKKNPEFIVKHAVKGMLPNNKLASRMIKRLKVYQGKEHPHEAQRPEKVNI